MFEADDLIWLQLNFIMIYTSEMFVVIIGKVPINKIY